MQATVNAVVDIALVLVRLWYTSTDSMSAHDLHRIIRKITTDLLGYEQETPERTIIESKALVHLAEVYHIETGW